MKFGTKNVLNDLYEIKNGIIGVNREVMFQLITLMHFRRDETIQNVFYKELFYNFFHS
jgi:hypothetical protein